MPQFTSVVRSPTGPRDPILRRQRAPHQDLPLLVRHPHRPVRVAEDAAVLPDRLLLLRLQNGAHPAVRGAGLAGTQHHARGLARRRGRDGARVPGGGGRGGRAGALPGAARAAHRVA